MGSAITSIIQSVLSRETAAVALVVAHSADVEVSAVGIGRWHPNAPVAARVWHGLQVDVVEREVVGNVGVEEPQPNDDESEERTTLRRDRRLHAAA
jgi:hypothetical protein